MWHFKERGYVDEIVIFRKYKVLQLHNFPMRKILRAFCKYVFYAKCGIHKVRKKNWGWKEKLYNVQCALCLVLKLPNDIYDAWS